MRLKIKYRTLATLTGYRTGTVPYRMTTTEYSSNAHPRNECSEEREVKIDADNTLSDPQLAQTGPMSPASTNCSAESSPSEVAAPVNRSLGRSRLLPYVRHLWIPTNVEMF